MPLSPSIRAVAGAVFSMRISGRLLKPPALRRRTYCGSRNTPWPSAPVRSASVINCAHWAASAAGNSAAIRASAIRPQIACAGTRTKVGIATSPSPHVAPSVRAGLTDERQGPIAEDRCLVGLRNRQRPDLPHALERTHVVRIVAAEHHPAGA